ncbi:flagellar biosynthetic protein FliQ [Methylocystis sp. WRRC1]|uniref:flagellar biosynthetic protein FliQ n=1 Tax=unclassified Methylocystis TaxID=2625913 RepID=UPI0001F87365|nr:MULTISPECIES: flagellar biosynthetic protein FliQ [unclassified Methylocystis]MCC3244889.1 flagellar biosynthetic protein FliQ [Methylocystis sp. WRRC1]
MNEADALEIVHRTIVTILLVSGPLVGAAMVVGVIVALVQALTQVQEMTLTFVPKIVAMLAVLSLSAPFIGSKIYALAQFVYSRIETGF